MDLEELRQLLDLVREHELAEFEIEHEGLRVKLRKDVNGVPVVSHPAASRRDSTSRNTSTPASSAPRAHCRTSTRSALAYDAKAVWMRHSRCRGACGPASF
jgi:biotin carboxyl carrier protein